MHHLWVLIVSNLSAFCWGLSRKGKCWFYFSCWDPGVKLDKSTERTTTSAKAVSVYQDMKSGKTL